MPNFKNFVLDDSDAREKILKGANKLANAVVSTLGPRGANVAYSRIDPYGNPWDYSSIHDGVKIAKEINLEDEAENIAAQILKEAAQKTVDEVGDGTTLTICLAQALINQCYQYIGSGVNAMSLRSGLEEGLDKLLVELKKHSISVKSEKEAITIATVSAGDPTLGKLVGETIYKMGVEGVVTVEESKSARTYVDHEEGMQLEHGYYHELFITNLERMDCVYENPYILITDKEINSLSEMVKLLEAVASESRPLVIISPSIGALGLEALIRNKLEGKLQCLAIKAPSFGDNMKGTLADISILTGATFITEDAGYKLKDIKLEHLGQAQSVTANKKQSIIVGGKGQKEEIEARKEAIKRALVEEEDDFRTVKLKERLGKLTNGISVIYAGGSTQIEMKEKFERLDDAVHATRAALKGGIIPGGETIFLRIRNILGKSEAERILYKALEQPFNRLVGNAGENAGALQVTLSQFQEDMPNYGFNVVSLKFMDMVREGIVDPVLVAEKALTNAVSVAIALMTTGTLIVPKVPEISKK